MAAKADLGEFTQLVADGHAGKQKRCKIRVLLDTVDAGDRVNLEAALALPQDDMPAVAVIAWASRRGVDVSGVAVAVHRRGKCSCGRRTDA